MIKNIIFILFFPFAFAQINLFSQCEPQEIPFRDGEKLNYEVSYNWGFVWVKAGKVTFETTVANVDGHTGFLFKSTGNSYGFYDWFYKVRDTITSFAGIHTIAPLTFTRKTYEGGYEVNNRYVFDKPSGKVSCFLQNSKAGQSFDTIPLEQCLFDLLSGVYYIRTLDFENVSPGYTFGVKFIIDGAVYTLPVTFISREILENRDGTKYRTIKFSAKVVAGTIFKEDKEIFVFVTDDKNKIPVYVEASIIVGSIKAYLTDYQNLKYNLSSIIK